MKIQPAIVCLVGIAALVALIAACGNDDTPVAPSTDAPPRGAEAEPETSGGPRKLAPQRRIELPKVAPLGDNAALGVLRTAVEDPVADEGTRAGLLYLIDAGDSAAAVNAVQPLLAQEGGEYDDPDEAGLALEVLLASGDASATADALALAEWAIAEEDVSPSIPQALARVEGDEQERAEKLLIQIATEGDGENEGLVAAQVLAERRVAAAAKSFIEIAFDTENREDRLRATAVAGLLALGHDRAQQAVESLLASEPGDEAIQGLAVPDLVEAVPVIARLVTRGAAEGDATFEFEAACYALTTIYRDRDDRTAARDQINAWLDEDSTLADDASTYALWMLGDRATTPQIIEILTREIVSTANHDFEIAINLLDEIARRGAANDPLYRPAVDAAAQVALDAETTARPGQADRLLRLNAAAAHAYLKAK